MNPNESPSPEVPSKGFILGDALYTKLKFMALVLLPALTTLYFTLGSVWHLPNVEQVIGTMTAVDTFLGVILGISTKSYNASDAKYDGSVLISDDGEKKSFLLELNGDPDTLDTKKQITFKVKPT